MYYRKMRMDVLCMAVQSFAATWNMVETKIHVMNGELVFIIIMSVKVLVIIATRFCIQFIRLL